MERMEKTEGGRGKRIGLKNNREKEADWKSENGHKRRERESEMKDERDKKEKETREN